MRIAMMAAVAVATVIFPGSSAHACTKSVFSTSLGAARAYFVGKATADTLLTGPGEVSYRIGVGHYGRADRRTIHGQVVEVERLGGPASALVPQGTREVVVVPWDYDGGCEPVPWGRSARWISPGIPGFYIADLRAPEHWVEGKPTFDLHNPGNLPYTGAARIRAMDRDTPVASLLSPEQVFGLYEALPTAEEITTRKSEALGSLRQWVQTHPDLARRPPAERLVRDVLSSVVRAELKEVDHPVLGTWRFKLHVPGDSVYTFYARSEAHPHSRWALSRTSVEHVPGQVKLEPAEGYVFLMAVAGTMESLPEGVRPWDYRQVAYIYAPALPDSAGAEIGEWLGLLESSLLEQAVPAVPLIQRAAAEALERFRSASWRLPEAPARFLRGIDGVLRVQQRFPLSDGSALLVEGERVSRTVLRNPW